MNNSIRLISGVIMAGVIFLTALYLIPSIGFIETLTDTTPIGGGDITQFSLLVISLILAYYLSGKKLSDYGFRPTGIKYLVKPIFISVLSVILFFIMMNIMMAVTGLNPDEMDGSGMNKSIPNFLITIALFASMCEEIFYRGLIYGFLQPLKIYRFRFFKIDISLPVAVCAVMFGLGHLCLLGIMNFVIVVSIVVSATLLGFIAGYYREKSGSIFPAIAAHMTFNLVAFGIPTIMMSAK